MKISRYLFVLTLLSSLLCPTASAQDEDKDKIPQAPLFCGVAVMADLAGPVMKVLDTRFNQLECGARLNFRDKYFPIAELGLGECSRDGQENNNHFRTRAPYFRVGMDYNLNKKHNGNRFFAGVRYAFSSYKFDFTNPDFADPVYPSAQQGFALKNKDARMQWAEIGLGCETRLWSFIRLGWTFRFKMRLHQKGNEYGDPYYVPGFGKNGSTTWGGACNLIFDVGRTSKKSKL